MESQSFPQIEIVKDLLDQILNAIDTLQEWNNNIEPLRDAIEFFILNIHTLEI